MKLGYHTLFVVILPKFVLKLGITDHHKCHFVIGPTEGKVVCNNYPLYCLPIFTACPIMPTSHAKQQPLPAQEAVPAAQDREAGADKYCLMVKY